MPSLAMPSLLYIRNAPHMCTALRSAAVLSNYMKSIVSSSINFCSCCSNLAGDLRVLNSNFRDLALDGSLLAKLRVAGPMGFDVSLDGLLGQKAAIR